MLRWSRWKGLPNTLTRLAYSNLHGLRMIKCFLKYLLSNWPAPQQRSQISFKISISTFSISISISQFIFIDTSISPISMTALIKTGKNNLLQPYLSSRHLLDGHTILNDTKNRADNIFEHFLKSQVRVILGPRQR